MSICVRLQLCILLLFNLAATLFGQSTEADIKARLKDKPLYLRGFWGDPQLHFNADGTLATPSRPLSFTVARFEFKSAKLKKDKLTLRGKRLGLEFERKSQKWVEVEDLDVEIASPANGDFGSAIDAIFAQDFASLAASLPSYWQHYAQCQLFPASDPAKRSTFCTPGAKANDAKTKFVGSVSAPKAEIHPDAQFNRFARKVRYNGVSVIDVIVETTGQPSHLQVSVPAGLGLDEQALASLEQWHFTPAMEDGKPVRSEVQIQVAFSIY